VRVSGEVGGLIIVRGADCAGCSPAAGSGGSHRPARIRARPQFEVATAPAHTRRDRPFESSHVRVHDPLLMLCPRLLSGIRDFSGDAASAWNPHCVRCVHPLRLPWSACGPAQRADPSTRTEPALPCAGCPRSVGGGSAVSAPVGQPRCSVTAKRRRSISGAHRRATPTAPKENVCVIRWLPGVIRRTRRRSPTLLRGPASPSCHG
jgi:hypothetical protein